VTPGIARTAIAPLESAGAHQNRWQRIRRGLVEKVKPVFGD
jgi:hypothetical protein